MAKYKNSIYDIYDKTTIHDFSNLNYSSTQYGFYDECDLPSIDSLKASGHYYFEVDTSWGIQENDCAELNIFEDNNGDTLMNIYYSSRQQYATYKKIKTLPKKILEYLKSKNIELPKELQNINYSQIIKTQKSTIYSAPNVKTKMYLIKDDVVEILEERNKWVKIRYTTDKGKYINGWLKKEDLE